MISEIVIDASVVLKWIPVPKEEKVEAAWEVYRRLLKGEINIIAPAFILIEVLNILIRKRRSDELMVKNVIKLLRECNIQFETLTVGEEISIGQMMIQYKVTAYDALYLLLAKKKKCPLITCDKELLQIKSLTMSLDELTAG